MSTARRTPIRWGDREFLLVAARWISFCETHAQDPLKPTMPMSRIIDDAQMALPENLHRPRPSLQGVKNLKPVLEAVRSLVRKKQEEALARVKEQEQQDGTAEVRRNVEALHGTHNRLVIRSTGSDVNEVHLEEVIQDFAHNIAVLIASQTMKVLREEFKNEFPKLHLKALSSTKVLPKLLVVGPLAKQQEDLERAVEGVVDLKFVSSEENARLIALRGSACQACVMWAAFVDHAHQTAAMKVFGRDSVRLITARGLNSVREAVEEIAIQVTSEA